MFTLGSDYRGLLFSKVAYVGNRSETDTRHRQKSPSMHCLDQSQANDVKNVSKFRILYRNWSCMRSITSINIQTLMLVRLKQQLCHTIESWYSHWQNVLYTSLSSYLRCQNGPEIHEWLDLVRDEISVVAASLVSRFYFCRHPDFMKHIQKFQYF